MIGGVDGTEGKIEKWKVTFNLTPAEATLVVKDLQGQVIQPVQGNNVYELETGVYTYSASAEEYISKENERLEVYKETTFNVTLVLIYTQYTFANATDEQLEKTLNAHYNGIFNIADYWHVGDTRKIHINAIPSSDTISESHVAQDMTFVIIGFNHDDLVTQAGTRKKSALTIQCREVMGNKGNTEYSYFWGKYINGQSSSSNYTQSPRRTWFNEVFLKSIPESLQKLVKTVVKKNLANHTTTTNAPLNSNELIFLLSYPEVIGTVKSNYYLNNGVVGDYEGYQYEYYKTADNRIKYVNNNGAKSSTKADWWLRSPSSNYYDNRVNHGGYGYEWCYYWDTPNNVNEILGAFGGDSDKYLAPAFCL